MIVSVTDWNLNLRFYEVPDDKFNEMMKLPRDGRKDFFKEHSKMAYVHCETEAEWWLPVYTDTDGSEWEEFEECYNG